MIYFDNAATTLKKPKSVVNAVVEAMHSCGNAGRGAASAALDADRIIYNTREKLSLLFHASDPKQIVFTNNSTESLNTAIKGLLVKGDHVISTQLEHNSVLRPLYEMQELGIELTIVPSDKKGKINYEDFEKSMQKNTKAIICTHGSNVTGNCLDMKVIGKIAKYYDVLLIVDASQTAGVHEIDVESMQIDVLCFTGHKSLLGPQGTGGMYIKKGLEIRPLKTGGSGIDTYNRYHPLELPTHLEAGTLNAHGIAGLGAAIDYINDVGMNHIREKELANMKRFYKGIRDIPGINIYGDFSTEIRCPIVTFNIGEYDSSKVSDELFLDYNIVTRSGAHCAPLLHNALGTTKQGAVRFSFSHYNTQEEVEKAIEAVKELAKE